MLLAPWPGTQASPLNALLLGGAGAAEAVATSVLQQLLNPQDAVLGPWVPRRDPLEDALNSFVGSAGGPSPHPWEAGMGFSAGYSGTAGEIFPAGGFLRHCWYPAKQARQLRHALCAASSDGRNLRCI